MWFLKFRQNLICKHKYKIGDIKLTGIKPTPPPIDGGYSEWEDYFKVIYTEDAHTKRVSCKCSKCGEVIYAHCGLDILKFN